MIKEILFAIIFIVLFAISVPFNVDFLAGGLFMAILWWDSVRSRNHTRIIDANLSDNT